MPSSSFYEIERVERIKLTSIKPLNTTKNSIREFSYIDYTTTVLNGNWGEIDEKKIFFMQKMYEGILLLQTYWLD